MYLQTILFFLFLIKLTNCDHLRQTSDDTANSPAETSATDFRQQLADPDYIKRELKDIILRSVDNDKDGFVSYEELKSYLTQLHEKNIEYNVDKQWVVYSPQIHEVFSWEGYEPEKKEVLTWDHYFNQTYPELVGVDIGIPINREQDTSRLLSPTEESSQENSVDNAVGSKAESTGDEDPQIKTLKLMVHRADARWKLADENGDTLLTKNEFKHLLHPDEGHEELQNLFVKEATEDMDLDKDGKICLDEFMKHLQVLATDQEKNDQNWLSSQQENFGRYLDKNKDGVLDGDEIKNWLVPNKSKKFAAEAKRLLDIADNNEDHKLSTVEFMEQYEHFMSLLPADYWQSPQDLASDSGLSRSELMSEGASHDEL